MKITVKPLTLERWPDFETVFNAKGCSVARGCWCMFYRESGKSLLSAGDRPREQRKRRMKALVGGGSTAGAHWLPRHGAGGLDFTRAARRVREAAALASDEASRRSVGVVDRVFRRPVRVPTPGRGRRIARRRGPLRTSVRRNAAGGLSGRQIPYPVATSLSGSGPSRCSMRPDFGKWRGASRGGRLCGCASGSEEPEAFPVGFKEATARGSCRRPWCLDSVALARAATYCGVRDTFRAFAYIQRAGCGPCVAGLPCRMNTR